MILLKKRLKVTPGVKPDFYMFSYNEQNLTKFHQQVFIVSYLLNSKIMVYVVDFAFM